jgi:hypothetical protein
LIFFFDEDVGGWGEHGGALVSGKPNQRREKTKERERDTLMEERENGGWS